MAKDILEVVHETARNLAGAGVMDAVTLREFDALCLPPIHEYTPDEIRAIRKRNKASQAVFAAYLNTSVSTVQKWERGQKHPHGPSQKLIDLVDRKGLGVLG